MRNYKELSQFETFLERFQYLRLDGVVGAQTFGFDRWINQQFYRSQEWKAVREFVIVRDGGRDLGIAGYEIHRGLYIHHMNPMTVEDIRHGNESILDSNFLITVSFKTHNAIHYGNEDLLPRDPVVRRAGDTTLW